MSMADIKDAIARGAIGTMIREEAFAEGERKGKVDTILAIWESRFGVVEDNVKQALLEATLDKVNDIIKHWATDQTVDQIRARLGL